LLALALGACSTLYALRAPARLGECPGPLPSTAELEGDFVLQERVRVRGGEVDTGLTAIVEKRGDTLVLVALTSMGAKAFSLEQVGQQVRVTEHMGRWNPVPPGNLLRDLHQLRLAAGAGDERSVHLVREDCGYEVTLVRIADSRRR
jgi:hypothetical protein